MDVETEPIHFTQDDHHSIQERPTHDAPIGSRTPAATGEDDPRREWKVLVTFSVTPVPMEHSSDLRAENKVLTVALLLEEGCGKGWTDGDRASVSVELRRWTNGKFLT